MSTQKSFKPTAWATAVLTAAMVFCKVAQITAIKSLPWIWVLAPLWIIPVAWVTLILAAILTTFITVTAVLLKERRKAKKDAARHKFNSSWFR